MQINSSPRRSAVANPEEDNLKVKHLKKLEKF